MNTIAPAVLLAAAFLTGCESPENSAPLAGPFSTKSTSVYEPGAARLNAIRDRSVLADFGGARTAAIDLLLEASESEHPVLRANAIEALQRAPERLGEPLRRALGDENRGVRFVAAMTVGDLRLVEMAPLVDPLRHDPSGSVQAAAIYALERCDRPVDLDPLAKLVISPDPEVRANTAMVLGRLGNESAIPLLKAAHHHPMPLVSPVRTRIVDIQISESLVSLGDAAALDTIRSALFAPVEEGETTALACMALGRVDDSVYAGTLREIALRTGEAQQSAEIRMAAVWALAHMQSQEAPLEVAVDYLRHERPEIRAQAVLTLGESRDPRQWKVISNMMADPHPLAQVAAAGAVLQIAM